MNTFAERFAALLHERGWTAEEASRHIGVSSVAVRAWMGSPGTKPVSDPRVSLVLSVCDLFDVRAEWLMRGELPRERSVAQADWPFITPRERIMALPAVVRALLDRIIFDVVEILSPEKFT